MNINEFTMRVEAHQEISNKTNPESVVIQVEDTNSVGGTPCVGIETMYAGFDWDDGKFIIIPSEPLIKKKNYNVAEKEFIVHAIKNGYKYICRCSNGDILISKTIPTRSVRSWKYDKKVSERTGLYKKDFSQITFKNGDVVELSCLLKNYR